MSDVDPLPEPATRRPVPWGPIGLVVALLFLAGAIGFLVGAQESDVPTSAVDEGFLLDMSEHHDQAVTMALYELDNGVDPDARHFATEVLITQRPDLDPDRPAMGWMGMDTTAATMPGMASEAELEQLRTSEGLEADELFLTLMQAHHAGGLHMSEDAAQRAEDPAVRELADRIARLQAKEINEYQVLLEQLRAGAA
jgi:uncharacterized protein (DUF305 family)